MSIIFASGCGQDEREKFVANGYSGIFLVKTSERNGMQCGVSILSNLLANRSQRHVLYLCFLAHRHAVAFCAGEVPDGSQIRIFFILVAQPASHYLRPAAHHARCAV